MKVCMKAWMYVCMYSRNRLEENEYLFLVLFTEVYYGGSHYQYNFAAATTFAHYSVLKAALDYFKRRSPYLADLQYILSNRQILHYEPKPIPT